MKMTAEEYARRVKQVGPRSPLGSDCLWAFCVGGGICLLGEVPVSYTHLDVYKRQVQSGVNANDRIADGLTHVISSGIDALCCQIGDILAVLLDVYKRQRMWWAAPTARSCISTSEEGT